MRTLFAVAITTCVGCAHLELSPAALETFNRPAIVARLETKGATSKVFRADGSYTQELKGMSAAEADARLAEKLTKGSKEGGPSMNRFELADSLRAQTLGALPQMAPWKNTINPVDVARVLESFLIEDAAAGKPDFTLLKQFDCDAVLEITVEEYGMRSESGRAGVYLLGRAKLFRLNDGAVLYQRIFESDEVKHNAPHLDPFAVAKTPGLFRERLRGVLVAIGEQLARDLSGPVHQAVPASSSPL